MNCDATIVVAWCNTLMLDRQGRAHHLMPMGRLLTFPVILYERDNRTSLRLLRIRIVPL